MIDRAAKSPARRALFPVLLACCAIPFLSGAEEDEADPFAPKPQPEALQGPSDQYYCSNVGTALPIIDLPKHVVAPKGELTLFADFDHRDPEMGIPLYLVNRTVKIQSIPVQDEDPYTKLEFQEKEGFWVRAQTHRDSFCGNSYYSRDLKPGEFFLFSGYSPASGTKAKIRYHNGKSGLLSNAGDGYYLEEDRDAAALDSMAAGAIPPALGWAMRADERSNPMGFPISDRTFMVALDLTSHYSESTYYRDLARRRMESLGENSPIANEIGAILDRKWPQPAVELDSLLNRSLDLIEQGVEIALNWSLVSHEIRFTSAEVSHETKARAAQLLRREAMAPKLDYTLMLKQLIESPSFANEYLPSDDLLNWLHSESKWIVGASARTLANREQFGDLVRIGPELKQEHQFAVLGALARGRERDQGFNVRNPDTPEEKAFWTHCLTADTREAVRNLPRIGNSYNLFHRIVKDPVQAYLETTRKEAGTKPRDTEEVYDIADMVRFLGSWRSKKDVPLLEDFLTFPWYSSAEASSSKLGDYVSREYRVRRVAYDILQTMRQPITKDVVVEVKILPSGEVISVNAGGGNATRNGDPFGR